MSPQKIRSSAGVEYVSAEMNFNGTCGDERITAGGLTYATHGEFGTVDDPLWICTLRDRNSVMRGRCRLATFDNGADAARNPACWV